MRESLKLIATIRKAANARHAGFGKLEVTTERQRDEVFI
jgi:hypothetical protein